MKLSISNIAWPNDNNGKVLEYLTSTMVSAIEIAPSHIWPDLLFGGAVAKKLVDGGANVTPIDNLSTGYLMLFFILQGSQEALLVGINR